MDTNKNILVPNEILKAICKYCENNAIYDKLANYKDFYYVIKKLLKRNLIMNEPYHIIVSIKNQQSVDIIANNKYSKDKIIEAFNDSHIPIISISSVIIDLSKPL